MPNLVDASVAERDVLAATLSASPLLAADDGCRAKTWLAANPGIGIRPWRQSKSGGRIHLVGWTDATPAKIDGTTIRTRYIHIEAGTVLELVGQVVAIRRNTDTRGYRHERDAAAGRADPSAAYAAWMTERMMDVLPHANLLNLTIDGFETRPALRKGGNGVVRNTKIPVVDATVTLEVLEPDGFSRWLLQGVGPQKAFGYGAFLPVSL